MKKNILWSSIMTIALCLSLISGATFAMFTSSDRVNIAVTSGNVNINADLLSDVKLYSAKKTTGDAENKYLKDPIWGNYEYEERTDGFFANGGTAAINSQTGELEISKMTPGDRVDFTVDVDNTSNVAIAYRYKIQANSDNELAKAMIIGGKAYTDLNGNHAHISAWQYLSANADPSSKTISILLPVTAGNECKNKTVNYTITVEAVQANAVNAGN